MYEFSLCPMAAFAPQWVLLERRDVANQNSKAAFGALVRHTHSGNPFQAMLGIPSIVPLELAKTLRKGDRLEVTGTLADVVQAVHSARKPPIAAAMFVIVDPAVQKIID